MLPGLIWFAELEMKSLCPQTRTADRVAAGNSSTRLFPLSQTKMFPLASIFTSVGADSELGDARGAAPPFAVP